MAQSRDIGYNKGQRMNKKTRMPRDSTAWIFDVRSWRIMLIISEVVSKHYAKGLCTFTVRHTIVRTVSQSSSNSRVIPTEYATESGSLIIN